ncbi:hypothetical protein O1L60_29765 [Streptomyces diastatochromogenes]|nr:hypothetical protein [Streptomyces diastatochromogenes]
MSPDATLAVFAGVHAVRAVEPSGRRAGRSGTPAGPGRAGRRTRRTTRTRIARTTVTPTGLRRLLRGRPPRLGPCPRPLADGEPDPDAVDEWLVIDAADGRVLARADAQAAAAGSLHLSDPADPHRMGLSIGEGQDGAPLRLGTWDGKDLDVTYVEGDLCLLGVSPSGDRLMTVSHDQDALAVRDFDGLVLDALEWDAESVLSPHPDAPTDDPDETPVHWDWAGGFLNDTTLLVSTEECDDEWGQARHWLLDTTRPRALHLISYPTPLRPADGTRRRHLDDPLRVRRRPARLDGRDVR